MARIFVDFRNGFRVKLHLLGVVAFPDCLDNPIVPDAGRAPGIAVSGRSRAVDVITLHMIRTNYRI